MTRPKEILNICRSPLCLALLIAAGALLAQFFILYYLEDYKEVWSGYHLLIDSILFTAVTLPSLYFFMYRPFVAEIASRQEAEEKAKTSEGNLKTIFDSMLDTCYRADANAVIEWISPSVTRLAGYLPEEIVGRKIIEFYVDPEMRKDLLVRLEKGNGVVAGFEAAMWHKNGSIVWISTNVHWTRGEDGKITGLEGVARDITAKRQAEWELKKSEQRFRDVIFTTGDIVWEIDTDGRYTFTSPQVIKTLGYSITEVRGKHFYDFIVTAEKEQTKKAMLEMMKTKKVFKTITCMHRHKSGRTVAMEISGCPFFDDTGEIKGYRGTSRDITKRIKTEEELKRLAMAVEQASEVVVITNAHGVIQYANPAFETLTGYKKEEALGQNPKILKSNKHNKSFYGDLWSTIKSGTPWRGHFINRKKSGELYEEDACIAPVFNSKGEITNYVAVKKDVTDIRLKDRQTRQNQKIEAIETVIGGVAHNFNNLLAAIIGHMQMALDEAPTNSNIRDNLGISLKASERAKNLTEQLLMFSHKIKGETRLVQLHSLIKTSIRKLKASMPPNIIIQEELAENSGMAHINPIQIKQVIMELGVNAEHAMKGISGAFTIRLTSVVVDDNKAAQLSGLLTGLYALITISDTGSGMDSHTLERIFDPFFTTKETNSGMGLTTVRGIVSAHGGAITANSTHGAGTTFEIYLPRAIGNLDGANEALTGTELILLVKEDKGQMQAVKKGLDKLGYQIVTRTGSNDASAMLNMWPDKFDIVMIDKSFACKETDELGHKTPVIVFTEYTEPLLIKEPAKTNKIWSVSADIKPKELAQLVRRIAED
ncbi:diguanylate cyclase/phosphodiesterase (GGDEF & EAL domains) with PAS/PAC sensor(s) [hydrothermal vent metagenome]|uniref:Diguanylate cyclase/phosphodiesterase (GGDEF & EAL domains) with PAS/PAC sensor(S) n=1 Tax=hydrothermal vent metagenome TaxID=652676 RepID=A0A3B1CBV8_9ZZZZ